MRSGAMLISPWVPAGAVFGAPKSGPTKSSQFEHSSIPATLKKLFGLPQTLTKRTAWAGTFDELLTDELRTDAPMHLPEARSSTTTILGELPSSSQTRIACHSAC